MSSEDPNSSLNKATVAIYAILSIPVIYILWKHGFRHGAFVGWLTLLAFCLLKLLSSGLLLKDENNTAAVIIGSIGLSPLLLSTLGLIHEGRTYAVEVANKTLETSWVVCEHISILLGVAILADGAVKLTHTDNTLDETLSAQKMTKGGIMILFIGWVIMLTMAILTFFRLPSQPRQALPFWSEGKFLVTAVLIATPFLAIRLLTAMVYFFDSPASLNPKTGSIGVRVGLEVIEEIIITIVYVVFGILTRNAGVRPRKSYGGPEQQPMGYVSQQQPTGYGPEQPIPYGEEQQPMPYGQR